MEVKARREATLRAGGYALALLAAPLNVYILRALGEGSASLAEIRRFAGSPPQTTMRKHLRGLAEAGILSKQRSGGFGGSVTYEMHKPGSDLLGVARAVEGWLAQAPEGPVELGTIAAKSALKALVDGWSTTLMRALAARPLSLTELDALITGVSYPSLERRLGAMRSAGQVETATASGRGTPYVVTDWLRRAIAPLVGAAYWERRHVAEMTTAIGRIDVEACFLLALPLIRLAPDLSGVCHLAVETSRGGDRRTIGVLAGIEQGRLAYCRARLEGNADAWVSGSVSTWFRAVATGEAEWLELRGDLQLAGGVLSGLHDKLAKPVPA